MVEFVENIVGIGGYSEVYRGDLWDGKRIAVKRLARESGDMNKEKEFLTELGIISHVSHPNTALLLGCCVERGLYLVFRFSENGNLYSALHGNLSSDDFHVVIMIDNISFFCLFNIDLVL